MQVYMYVGPDIHVHGLIQEVGEGEGAGIWWLANLPPLMINRFIRLSIHTLTRTLSKLKLVLDFYLFFTVISSRLQN